MNIYVEPITSSLTENQLYIVNEADRIFSKLGSEFHLGELLITNFDEVDDIPQTLMETYNYYVERELYKYVALNEDVTLYDKVSILSTVAKILFGEIYTEVDIPEGIDEEEFLWELLSQVTEQNSIYWEDKVTILPDLYEMFYAGIINEVDEDDVPVVDSNVKDKVKEYLSTIENHETLAMYDIIVTSTVLPLDFDKALFRLVGLMTEDFDKVVLVTEIELLEIATDAHNTTADWQERVTNVFGYFPSKVGKIVEGF